MTAYWTQKKYYQNTGEYDKPQVYLKEQAQKTRYADVIASSYCFVHHSYVTFGLVSQPAILRVCA